MKAINYFKKSLVQPARLCAKGQQKGTALVLALMAFLVLSAVGLMVFLTVAEDFNIARNHAEIVQCLYISEAGLNYALSKLNSDSGWSGLLYPGRVVGAGYFMVYVSDSTSAGTPLSSGQKRINVKAKILTTEREIEVIAQ